MTAAGDWAVRAPHPALRGLVTRYIGYTQHDVTLAVHRGLPGRHVTLIVSLAEPIRFVGGTSLRAPVGGLHTAPALIEQDRFQSGVHLELSPLGTRTLLGMPAAELGGVVVDLADLGSPELATLPERLVATPTWTERFAVLDSVLRAVAVQRGAPVPEVTWAWRRLADAGGLVRVESLAQEVGWSRRHLGARFRAELGLSPKQAARVLRFERASEVLRAGGRVDLGELAVRCGYYDQAHLTNEWRALAGCSPGRWIAEELPALASD